MDRRDHSTAACLPARTRESATAHAAVVDRIPTADEKLAGGATVVDLIHLPRGTRPTPIAYLEVEEIQRCREMYCENYAECLDFAARVRWKSFHCRQCPRYRANHTPEKDQAPTSLARVIDMSPRHS